MLGSVRMDRGPDISGHGGHNNSDGGLFDIGRTVADKRSNFGRGLRQRPRRRLVQRSVDFVQRIVVHARTRAPARPGSPVQTGQGQAATAMATQRRNQGTGHGIPVGGRSSAAAVGRAEHVQRQAADVRQPAGLGLGERRDQVFVRQKDEESGRFAARPAGVQRLVVVVVGRTCSHEVRRGKTGDETSQEDRQTASGALLAAPGRLRIVVAARHRDQATGFAATVAGR